MTNWPASCTPKQQQMTVMKTHHGLVYEVVQMVDAQDEDGDQNGRPKIVTAAAQLIADTRSWKQLSVKRLSTLRKLHTGNQPAIPVSLHTLSHHAA